MVTVRFVPNKSVYTDRYTCTGGLILMILFTQLQYGVCTFMCNDCLYNVLQVCIFLLSENVFMCNDCLYNVLQVYIFLLSENI